METYQGPFPTLGVLWKNIDASGSGDGLHLSVSFQSRKTAHVTSFLITWLVAQSVTSLKMRFALCKCSLVLYPELPVLSLAGVEGWYGNFTVLSQMQAYF